MLSNVRNILIIIRKEDLISFKSLLGNGEQLGINIKYAIQKKPNGIAESFLIGEKFISKSNCILILGDNIFYGEGFRKKLLRAKNRDYGATVFSYQVKDPERYGVVEINKEGNPMKIVEKPKKPKSNLAVTGLYFYDNEIIKIAKSLKPSARGELEITDVNKVYLEKKRLFIEQFGRGFAWLDTGTPDSLLAANNFVSTIQKRQGLTIACLEEIAYRNEWITKKQLEKLTKLLPIGSYKEYLKKIIK